MQSCFDFRSASSLNPKPCKHRCPAWLFQGMWPSCNLVLWRLLQKMELTSHMLDVLLYMQAHPSINEADASRLFKVISYQKLGAETCKAAAQNPRFPPSFVIQLALVQLRASNEGSLCSSRDTESSLSSTTSKGSPRVGQQTVVHVQCSHFEFTLRQIQPDKKMTDTSRPERTNSSTLQCVKKTESRMCSFDSGHSSGKRSRLEMISGFHRLKQLFHSKSRQHWIRDPAPLYWGLDEHTNFLYNSTARFFCTHYGINSTYFHLQLCFELQMFLLKCGVVNFP